MNKNIRWLQYSIGLILLIISLISIFNYKVDSSGVFGHSTNDLAEAAKGFDKRKNDSWITVHKQVASMRMVTKKRNCIITPLYRNVLDVKEVMPSGK